MIHECRRIIADELAKPKEKRNRDIMGKCSEKLFEFEQGLFAYCDMLKDNPSSRIVIDESGVYVDINSYGHSLKMYLDPVDRGTIPAQILAKGTYEEEELDMVFKIIDHLPKDPVILDIGANLGWYGINAQNMYERSTVYYFEPVPDTAERLKKNVELNGYDINHVFKIGLYEKNIKTQFYFDTVASGASSLADLRELPTTKIVEVELKRLDDFVSDKGIGHVDFIKCDVEGAELFVYRGGLETIKKNLPVVFSEMLRKWAAKRGYHPNDIISFFRELGYGCFVINNGGLKQFDVVTDETVETNYFFLHKEKHRSIIEAEELA